MWKGGLKSWLQNASRNICATGVHILKSTVRAIFLDFVSALPLFLIPLLQKIKTIHPSESNPMRKPPGGFRVRDFNHWAASEPNNVKWRLCTYPCIYLWLHHSHSCQQHGFPYPPIVNLPSITALCVPITFTISMLAVLCLRTTQLLNACATPIPCTPPNQHHYSESVALCDDDITIDDTAQNVTPL